MKNLIIAGVPRSGKTTLARRLCIDLGFSLFPADTVVSTMGRLFPEHGISHYEEDHDKACETFRPFLRELLRHLEYEGFPFVIDTYHVLPLSLVELKDTYGIVFMGYPSVDPREKLRHIRRCARAQDWTEDVPDAVLFEQVQRYIDESRMLEDACSEIGIPFVDTSPRFEQAIQRAFETLSQSVDDCP
jgi:2-phosphoglycerate kinase